MRNSANSIRITLGLLILVLGACTKGKPHQEIAAKDNDNPDSLTENSPVPGKENTAKDNDNPSTTTENPNNTLHIKDAHEYYTLRGDHAKEAYIEILIDQPELLSTGSAFRIQYNPLPIYGGQDNVLITIDSFSFSSIASSYLRSINQSPPGFYRIEHNDLGWYEVLVTDSTTVQFRQGEGGGLKLTSGGATSDYYDIILAIKDASVGQNLENFKASYPLIAEAARDILKSKSSNVYLDFFMALFDRMDGASAKNIQSIMKRMDNIDYQQALIVHRNVPFDFILPDPAGNFISLNDYSNQVVLLDFWASWCAPCRQENPNLVRLYETYNEEGFDIVSVSLDQLRDRWSQAIEEDNLKWKGHCSDLKGWESDLSMMYGIFEIPSSLLIGRDGFIIWTSRNPSKSLEEAIQEAL